MIGVAIGPPIIHCPECTIKKRESYKPAGHFKLNVNNQDYLYPYYDENSSNNVYHDPNCAECKRFDLIYNKQW